jgi:apolipoprotein N-acyltransferase
MTVAFWLYYRLRLVTGKLLSYTGLISFWLGYEYLHQTWDLSFPWMNLGNAFSNFHQIIQWYEFTGVYGGTLWVWIANILAFEILLSRSDSAMLPYRKKLAVALAVVIILPVLYSLTIYTNYKEETNPANIVVVQPNIDPYSKFGGIPVSQQIQSLIHLSDSAGQSNTEYFVWPETAISEYVEEGRVQQNISYLMVTQFLGKYKNGNVLSGISSYSVYSSAKTPSSYYSQSFGSYIDEYNAAIQIENSSRVQFYHKSKLVPGVELIPFSALSFLRPIFAGFGGGGSYGSQKEPSVFYSQSGIGASPVICYESVWGDWVAKSVKNGAQFIAIVTNDAWWGNTSGKDQHFLYARLRAIETRRWIARSANTGISGFINQRGDITQKSGWWQATALKEDINLNEEITFYTRYEDLIAILASVISGVLLVFLLFKKLNNPHAKRLALNR